MHTENVHTVQSKHTICHCSIHFQT